MKNLFVFWGQIALELWGHIALELWGQIALELWGQIALQKVIKFCFEYFLARYYATRYAARYDAARHDAARYDSKSTNWRASRSTERGAGLRIPTSAWTPCSPSSPSRRGSRRYTWSATASLLHIKIKSAKMCRTALQIAWSKDLSEKWAKREVLSQTQGSDKSLQHTKQISDKQEKTKKRENRSQGQPQADDLAVITATG